MEKPAAERPVLNEEVWLAWLKKGKLREQAAARKYKRLAGVALALLSLGIAVWFFLANQHRGRTDSAPAASVRSTWVA